MKKLFFISFLFFGADSFAQPGNTYVFNDTLVYFINSMQISLSAEELKQTSTLLVNAIAKYKADWEHWMDSLAPKSKKKFRIVYIDPADYYYRLTAYMNKDNQKVVEISASCKGKYVPDKEWKKKFLDGHVVADGGTCFLYLTVNLALQSHNGLTSNGLG